MGQFQDLSQPKSTSGSGQALGQIAAILEDELSLDINSTRSHTRRRQGILSAAAVVQDDIIEVRFLISRAHGHARVPMTEFFKHSAGLSERVHFMPPKKAANGALELWLSIRVNAVPLSVSRQNALLDELKRLDKFAEAVQMHLPTRQSKRDLKKVYADFENVLEPAQVLDGALLKEIALVPEALAWAETVLDFVGGANSIAIAGPTAVELEMAGALMATVVAEAGASVGELVLPAIDAKTLVELARKAPGIVLMRAAGLSLATNPYELGNEIGSTLETLAGAGEAILFTGSYDELQRVFQGGQGAKADPLTPILRRTPEIPAETLTRFALLKASEAVGGIPEKDLSDMVDQIAEALLATDTDNRNRMIPSLAKRAIADWDNGSQTNGSGQRTYVVRLAALTETFCGLSPKPRVDRAATVASEFTRTLTDPELLAYFKDHLLAQDRALKELVARLSTEALTRPAHQPIRYCAQGTPATGKSESAALLARRLNVPFVNIDAASLPDYHSAASQLLGSGRGIVMSHQPGRLEQVAKHHSGAVVEVSDLDHATPSVRSMLADLFLQVLETGQAQSTTGSMFSCANIIFAFTMNLPDGLDEKVRKGLGFNNAPSEDDVNRDVAREIKSMLSGAFLSRIGTPILFEPLAGVALETILANAVRDAVTAGIERSGSPAKEVTVSNNLGRKLLETLKGDLESGGARVLHEQGRKLAAQAFLTLKADGVGIAGKKVRISPGPGQSLKIEAS